MGIGSPPRMRGKALVLVLAIVNQRITPAYAGKRLKVWKRCSHDRDHPRVCGEKSGTEDGTEPEPGSPPRMRGKVLTGFCGTASNRITPAYAGKSKS